MAADIIDDNIFRIIAELNGLERPYQNSQMYSFPLPDGLGNDVISIHQNHIYFTGFKHRRVFNYFDFESNAKLISAMKSDLEKIDSRYKESYYRILSTVKAYYRRAENLKAFK